MECILFSARRSAGITPRVPNLTLLLSAAFNPAPLPLLSPFCTSPKSAEGGIFIYLFFSPLSLGRLTSRADSKLQEKGFFTLGYSLQWQKLYQTSLTRIWLNEL